MRRNQLHSCEPQPLATQRCNEKYLVGAFGRRRGAAMPPWGACRCVRWVACYLELRRMPLLRTRVNKTAASVDGRSLRACLAKVHGALWQTASPAGAVVSQRSVGYFILLVHRKSLHNNRPSLSLTSHALAAWRWRLFVPGLLIGGALAP
jgi:hypothetical protein